jgi:hypothetical protein
MAISGWIIAKLKSMSWCWIKDADENYFEEKWPLHLGVNLRMTAFSDIVDYTASKWYGLSYINLRAFDIYIYICLYINMCTYIHKYIYNSVGNGTQDLLHVRQVLCHGARPSALE